jgi:pyruvate,water dikinase
MNEFAVKSPTLGNKVKNLAVLAQKGVRVPRGFGLPFEVYTDHVAALLPTMRQAREEVSNYANMSKRLHEIITSVPLNGSSNVLRALEEHMPGAYYFAVRSSGAPVIGGKQAVEDSAELSLAGQFESFLLVPTRNVPNVVLLCYASLFSERCLRQFNVMDNESYLNSRMSVLVQEMCQADLSAVVMTRDPVEGGDNFGIEITYGACEALVSGELQGDLYLLSRTTGDVLDKQLGTKNAYIKYDPLVDLRTDNKKLCPLPDDMRNRYAAPQRIIDEIFNLGMRIEGYYNAPQDIELVVHGEEIIIVQTRPITAGK